MRLYDPDCTLECHMLMLCDIIQTFGLQTNCSVIFFTCQVQKVQSKISILILKKDFFFLPKMYIFCALLININDIAKPG